MGRWGGDWRGTDRLGADWQVGWGRAGAGTTRVVGLGRRGVGWSVGLGGRGQGRAGKSGRPGSRWEVGLGWAGGDTGSRGGERAGQALAWRGRRVGRGRGDWTRVVGTSEHEP